MRAMDVDGLLVDMGAQYFDSAVVAAGPYDKAHAAWLKAGVVEAWHPSILRFRADGSVDRIRPRESFVGVPTMSAVATHMANGLRVKTSFAVGGIQKSANGWDVFDHNHHRVENFRYVVVATPPRVALFLLKNQVVNWLDDAEKAREATSHCWTVIVHFATLTRWCRQW